MALLIVIATALVLVMAILAVQVVVPAAAAKPSPQVRVSLLPLPKAAIGPAAKSLPPGTLGGAPVSEGHGYWLEYGDPFEGGSGVLDVGTQVDQLETVGLAKSDLLDQRAETAFAVLGPQLGVAVSGGGFVVSNKDVTRYTASNIDPLSSVVNWFRDGRYVLGVSVSAGTSSAATKLAQSLAKKLDKRLHLALAGRLHAKPVKLPPRKAGPPPGGPDLSALALSTADLTGHASLVKHRYTYDRYGSQYTVEMEPAGPFGYLTQTIEWYPTANEASFMADKDNAYGLTVEKWVPLALSGVGDGARASVRPAHAPAYFGPGAQVVFSTGRLKDLLWLSGVPRSAARDSDIRNIAKAAANKIGAAGLGG